jgi:glyoxylase-like metal-dependent hydrolase (beta-lactamase superfamily II)
MPTNWSVHTHRAGEDGLYVNSYLVETPTGVVVIDTSLLVADIAALEARLAALRKPLRAVFVTHAHPDHFNGVAALVRGRDVPVYATAGVAKTIGEIADSKRAQWGPVYGDQWPATTHAPDSELADGEPVTLDELTVTAYELGAGESHADSYLLVERADGPAAAFIGDLAFHGTHPYTADGHTAGWLDTLDRLAGELATVPVLYPGHGMPGGPELLAAQRRYLMFYREAVRRLAAGEPVLTDPARAELDDLLGRFLPGAPLTWMIGLGADAVAAEILSSDGRPPA